ncbi:VanW family protein [Blastococcus sp. TF02A-30]|uniref:VanW family protein n=1 Tax=Blastococcus sp. TF02A-30 TaxID=2250580 RepID=UPI000DEA836F|nr:VanW family protein [Blastococcus sp. TF02A-30]RBY91179.1 vanomycin resistance protein VanB [Blastococcus sp. TF02A-30]
MPEQHPAHDETVRMPADGGSSRPPVDGPRPGGDEVPPAPATGSFAAVGGEADDTRPVPRDWLSGAPDAEGSADGGQHDTRAVEDAVPPAGPSGGDDVGTQPVDGFPRTVPGGPDGPDAPGSPWWRRRAVLVPVGAVAALGAVYGADLLLSSGDVPRSTVVAGVDVGGLSPAAAADRLEEELAPRVAADRPVLADDVEGTFSPTASGVALDVERTVDVADDQPLNPWTRVVTLFSDREVDPVLSTDREALDRGLASIAELVDVPHTDATIAIEGTTPSVVPPAEGRALDRDGAERALTEALSAGEPADEPVELPVEVDPFDVDADEAQRVLDETVVPALSAPVTVGGEGETAEVPVGAIAASLTFTPTEEGELQVGLDPVKLGESLGDELGVFGTPAKDATFQVSGGAVQVVPSEDGTGVDPARLAEQLLPVLTAPAPRTVTAELGPIPAEFTTEEAQALGIREEISSFTTNIGNANSGENIRVVAEEVDGALILPGETFSLNGYTGPRGTAQGYVEATVIQRGELAKAVGGGISQFATTMFNAVFFAGLEDVYHKPHSFYISRYPAGREATVYEGVIDLQWRNDSDTGVFVDTQWTPGSITVTFYGTKRYDIESVSSSRTNHREPAVQQKVDDGSCIPQPGVPGFDITVTRIFKDPATGAELKRENFNTRYQAEAIITCVPPGGDPAAPAADAPAPGGG